MAFPSPCGVIRRPRDWMQPFADLAVRCLVVEKVEFEHRWNGARRTVRRRGHHFAPRGVFFVHGDREHVEP
eukprot:1853327-Rhodomonas_salina.1